MATAQNEASSLTLAEEGGGTLTLTQRALPYMPLTISGKQRAEFVWYPGSPQATVQMLGPEEGVITLKGFWKDKFIQGTGAAKFVSAEVNDIRTFLHVSDTRMAGVADVVSLVKLVDTMRRMGRRITLSWDKLQRIGHITSFTQTWHTTHYCEWELEFSVAAQEESSVLSTIANRPNLATAAVQSSGWVGSYREAQATIAEVPKVLAISAEASRIMNDFDTAALRVANTFASASNQLALGISLGPNLARTAIATCSGFINSCNLAIGAVTDTALTEMFSIGAAFAEAQSLITGETPQIREDSLPFGVQLGGASYTRNLKTTWLSIRNNNAALRYEYQRQLQGNNVRSINVKTDTDLRDISLQYYGTQNQWRQLMLYNGFSTSRLLAGELVFVPQDASVLGASTTRGGI